MDILFAEAKRLYNLGFAIIWLHPKSKRPIESGWGKGERKSWDHLKTTYKCGMNVGVELGLASLIAKKYLCVIDVDIKSADPKHLVEAEEAIKKLTQGLTLPEVRSGRGNGSRHLYCLTETPFKTYNPFESSELVKYKSPTKKPSQKELRELSETEISEGIRLSRAWEISLYSNGRQVVLPPSIHPDSKKEYEWMRTFERCENLMTYDFDKNIKETKNVLEKGKEIKEGTTIVQPLGEFRATTVDLGWLDLEISIREGIQSGTGIDDRSSFLFTAAQALYDNGLTRDEILSVLTEPGNYISSCAFEHARTSSRSKAASWLWKYTVSKIYQARDAQTIFENLPKGVEAETLLAEESRKQEQELITWEEKLDRDKWGRIKTTFINVKTAIQGHFGSAALKLNEFANNSEMWGDFNWVAPIGREALDIDPIMIKDWCASKLSFEPSTSIIKEVCGLVAFENKYHPVKEWLEKLPRWDGESRVDKLLKNYMPCEGNEELRSVVGRRFLVALVKRIFEPGCQCDYILILEGLQGLKKSSAFRALIGDKWFSDATFNVNDKDAVMVIFSKWLIEFGELSTLDKTTAEHTKAFITRRTDRIRAPFDSKARDYPRQCLFVGSTNKGEYLKDDSGNRRYWPFRVIDECNTDLLEKDREQLFAEAFHLYREGEISYLKEPHLKALMLEQQEAREMYDVITEQVAELIEQEEKNTGEPMDHFQIKFFFEGNKLNGVKADQYHTARIGTSLKKLGYFQYRESTGLRRRLWSKNDPKLVSKNEEEIETFF